MPKVLLPQKRKLIIDKGVLTTWLLDLRSARQLKMKSTGARLALARRHALAFGQLIFIWKQEYLAPADLIRDIKQGFYVTELMGMGVNGVTGDYSQAAAGFWIENGTICFSGQRNDHREQFERYVQRNLTPANDFEFLRGVDAPTLRIEGMTVAGL